MPSADASARPSQVTVAGWGIAIASAVLLVSVFDASGNLHSIDVRDQITQTLRTGSAKSLGLTVDDALEIMRWSLYVTGVAAAAAAILGIYVLQRNKGARIGVTVAAVPIVLTAPFAGSFLGMFVGVGTAFLWSRPARDWFAGRPVTQRDRGPVEPPAPAAPRVQTPAPWIPALPPQSATPPAPPSMPPWGAQAAPLPPPGYGRAFGPPVLDRGRPPRQIRVACILTWVFSAITGLMVLLTLAALAIDHDELMARVRDALNPNSSYTDSAIISVVVVSSVLVLLWCLGASVVAVFTWRGAAWAWILHAVSTGGAVLVAVLFFPVSVVHLAAIGITFGMLLSAPARSWFRGR